MSKKEKSKEKHERDTRIWKIRDKIQKLEDVKDDIITLFVEQFNNSEGNIWITDAKEVYYCIVSAWEMLRAVSEGKKKYIGSAKGFLALAKSRLEQCSSELKVCNEEGSKLDSILRDTFDKCWNAIDTELERLTPKEEAQPPSHRVIKLSDTEYQLPCSICGKIAFEFWIKIPQPANKRSLICSGIVHRAGINIAAAEKIFSWLEQGQISQVHSYLEHNTVVFEEGIDAYCPECDKIYCGSHMETREEWDEGFYDCTYGTCPENHTRIIHD